MGATTSTDLDKGRVIYKDDESVEARYKLNDIFCCAWLSHAITALVRHGVPDSFSDSRAHVHQIAEATKLHAPSLYRALRAASANGIFREVEPGVFEHNSVSKLLRSDNPFSWKGMACMWNHPSCLAAWSKFTDVLTDGRSGVEHAFGKTLYEHLAEEPGATIAFSDAMVSNSAHVSRTIAGAFPFGHFTRVMDMAGGVGSLLAPILEEHQHLRGILYEIEELKDEAEKYMSQRGLGARTEVVVGNFIECVPEGADLYMVKNSLWNWDDDNCSAIMRNVRNAIGANKNARFLIIEYIIDELNESWTTLYDLQILNMPGGRARTTAEYAKLLGDSGFVTERIQHVEDQTLLLARPF